MVAAGVDTRAVSVVALTWAAALGALIWAAALAEAASAVRKGFRQWLCGSSVCATRGHFDHDRGFGRRFGFGPGYGYYDYG